MAGRPLTSRFTGERAFNGRFVEAGSSGRFVEVEPTDRFAGEGEGR